MQAIRETRTYEIEVHFVLEQIQAPDNVLMVHKAHDHDLSRDTSKKLVIPPGMVGYFVFDNELHGDFIPVESVACRHDETISACAQFVAEKIGPREERVELMVCGKTRIEHASFGETDIF